MFPIGDDNPTLRTPLMTYALLAALAVIWVTQQGAGLTLDLVKSVCDLGMVPGELTGLAEVGVAVPLAEGLYCVVDREAINVFTPVTSMFLHGGWMHLLGNALYLWVFGNNVEDSMGRARFIVFYLLCGLVAAAAHVFVEPGSPIPTVGASGAISGVLAAYLLFYPRVHVRMIILPFIFLRIPIPAWAVLIWWFGTQLLSGLPQLTRINPDVSDGVAYWAHIGGFVAGLVLAKLFEDKTLKHEKDRIRHVLHPYSP